MIRTKTTIDKVHRPESEANKYYQEELMLMKTQDIGYVLQKAQGERKKTEKLTIPVDNQPSNQHVYFAEDRKIARSYGELEARKTRLSQLEKIYMDMSMKKELQKKGRKCKLPEDEIVCPTSKPVCKWRLKESDERNSASSLSFHP